MADISIKQDVPNRREIEKRIARALGSNFSQQMNELLDLLGDPPDINNITFKFWLDVDEKNRSVLVPVFVDIFGKQAMVIMNELSFAVDWALVNEWAIDWASSTAFELVSGITQKTQRGLSKAIEAYYRDGLSKDDLAGLISPYFGPVRAGMIAATETTRASVQGEMAIVKWIEQNNPNIKMIAIWQTANDERVCSICGPRHNTTMEEGGWIDPPPAHPNCRCWINHEMTIIER